MFYPAIALEPQFAEAHPSEEQMNEWAMHALVLNAPSVAVANWAHNLCESVRWCLGGIDEYAIE